MKVDLTIRGEVSALHLEPGDRVLVTINEKHALTEQDLADLKAALDAKFEGHEVLILHGLSVAKQVAE